MKDIIPLKIIEDQESTGMPVKPDQQIHIFRWISLETIDNLHVTALNPGNGRIMLNLDMEADGSFAIEMSAGDGYIRTIFLTSDLKFTFN